MEKTGIRDNNIETYLTTRDPKPRLLKDDMNLKLCVKCNAVWERFHAGRVQVNKYRDMPTYGLPRENCDECR